MIRTRDDFELGCSWFSAAPSNQGLSNAHVEAVLRHEVWGWTSAVFVRDPLERFLSGYISKCTPGHDPDRFICERAFGATNATFAQAVAKVAALAAAGRDFPHGSAGDHFRRQSAFCGGSVGRGEFDLYYTLHRETSRRDAIDMLQHVGIADPPAAVPSFDADFPPPGEALASPRAGGDHVTHAAEQRARYYGNPADPKLVRALLSYFGPDYYNLPVEVPRWAVDAIGSNEVARLVYGNGRHR